MTETRNEIITKGFEALRRELGPSGFIVFMQQFGMGRGNYAVDRHAWVDATTMDQLRALIDENRGKKNP